jgi:hypothetical protein
MEIPRRKTSPKDGKDWAHPARDPCAVWTAHMRAGEFEAAWRISDLLLAKSPPHVPDLPRHMRSVWDGSPLMGRRVLVRCYRGLGDTLQFVRFLPRLKSIAAEVILWVQPCLIPLLDSLGGRGFDRVIPLHDGTPQTDFDTDIEIMELAHAFRVNDQSIPPAPYLHVPLATAPARGRMSVGLTFRTGDWDPLRKIPSSFLAPLFSTPGIDWVVCHESRDPADPRGPTIRQFRGGIDRLARTLCGLDLVITVDTMCAHLAGALGVPVWTLLHAQADWRWMLDREDSPWYPSMRLFRQDLPGDWAPVIDRVRAALQQLSTARLAGEAAEPAAKTL